MEVTLSSISAVSPFLSAYIPQSLRFVNSDRNLNISVSSVSSNDLYLSFLEFSKYFKDINFNENYFYFLTDKSVLSSYINSVTQISSNFYGYNMVEFNTRYNWIQNNFTQNSTAFNDTQFLGIVDNQLKFNILPLKTKTSINNEEYSLNEDYREYQKIYDIADSLFLQFKIDKIPFALEPDKYSLLFNSYDVASCYINDAEFINNGAVGGDCPLNSDVIFFEQNEYGSYTNNGPENVNIINNGTLLCLWLSSQSVEPSSNKIWAERWYDPNTVSQGDAFISQKNSLSSSFSYIVDLPSNKVLSEKEKLTYLRYGPKRNETFLNSFSDDLQIYFKNWNSEFSSEVNNVSGYIVGNYPLVSDALDLNGSVYAHVPPEDDLYLENDITIGLWAYADDWETNNDSQFFGNFYNESGYGIFYNTGTTNNLISIPTSGHSLYALNYKGYKVFEKDLKDDLGLSAISIDYMKTDLFGNRWLYDSYNHNLYKIENDDLAVRTVNLPVNSVITKIDCDSNNNIYFLDNYSKSISSINSFGEFLSSGTISSYQDIFEIDLNNNIIVDSAEFLTFNSLNQPIKMIGPTLYVNNDRVLHLTDKPQSLRIDSYDNIWILFKNQIIKTDPKGNILIQKTIHLSFSNTDGEICFIKNYSNNKEIIQLWIVFNKGKQIIILDSDANIVKRIDLSNIFVGSSCQDFDLNVNGDFSGFDSKRKFERIDSEAITIEKPAFSVRAELICGNDRQLLRLDIPALSARGWNHLAFSIKNSQDSTVAKFYLNGRLVDSKSYNKNYKIDYQYRSTPFIIGGVSGKLGAKNIEKAIIRDGYFIGKIDEIRMYKKALNDFQILNLYLNTYYNKWNPISFYIKTPEMTMMEEINTFYVNRYKGFKSNYFNIRIKNFTNDSDIRNLIETYIRANISSFTPANTQLNEVIFE
jgi:hypothetical protein